MLTDSAEIQLQLCLYRRTRFRCDSKVLACDLSDCSTRFLDSMRYYRTGGSELIGEERVDGIFDGTVIDIRRLPSSLPCSFIPLRSYVSVSGTLDVSDYYTLS